MRWALALIAGLAVVGPAAPASAQDAGPVSAPADRAALGTAPPQVTLTFSRPPDAAQSHVAVLAADGSQVNRADSPVRSGDSLIQPVAIRGPGDFTIVYHVVFTDGGDVEGSRRFSVGTGVPPNTSAAVPAVAHDHGVDPVSAVLLLIDGAVALGVLFLLLIRRPGSGPVAWRLTPTERKSDDQPT